MVTIKFSTENAAFAGEQYAYEIARILQHISESIQQGNDVGHIRDINGNKVGEWRI